MINSPVHKTVKLARKWLVALRLAARQLRGLAGFGGLVGGTADVSRSWRPKASAVRTVSLMLTGLSSRRVGVIPAALLRSYVAGIVGSAA